MKILVACEESQAVTIELRKLGHEAYSCDIEPCSGGYSEWHLQEDVIPLLKKKWDMIIAFPPCTHLAVSGAASFEQKRKDGRQQQGIEFFMKFVNCECEKIAIENPIGIMSSIYKKPDQIIQPWQFGDKVGKSTCLWIKGLPKLIPHMSEKPEPEYFEWIDKNGKKKRQEMWYYKTRCLPPKERGKSASKTFPGIAKAMATQWSGGNKMGVMDKIKQAATKSGTKIQTSELQKLETIFNKMFYLDKDIEEETLFINQVMTRGLESQERVGLHASSIIVSDNKFCLRQMVLSLLYKQLQGQEIKIVLKRIYDEGNAMHEKWQRLFIRAGYAKAKTCDKTRIDEQYQVSYSPDIVCRIPEFFEGAMVGEFKTMNTFQFKKMLQAPIPRHPSASHQVQLYMHLCIKAAKEKGVWNGIDYTKGFVLTEDKNDQFYNLELYDYDKAEIETYVERLEDTATARDIFIVEKQLYERHKKCDSYTCQMAENCVMKDACWNKGMGRILL